MKIIDEIGNWKMDKGTILAIGNFDGIHRGHVELIETMKYENIDEKLSSVIFTFSGATHKENRLIYTEREKEEMFKEFGVDYLYIQNFNESFARMAPEEFVKKLLVSVFKCKKIVVGFNFRFGYMAKGNVKLLEQLLPKYGIELIVVDKIIIDGRVVSSTLIRSLIQEGDMKSIPRFLGRYYSMEDRVIKGRQVGRTMGFPTANIIPDMHKIIVPRGVYCTEVRIAGKKDTYYGITNVGVIPTFNVNKLSVETHILDFEEDIYGEYIKINFLDKIRNEKKFNTIDELIKQISSDKEYARSVIASRI